MIFFLVNFIKKKCFILFTLFLVIKLSIFFEENVVWVCVRVINLIEKNLGLTLMTAYDAGILFF